MKKLPLLITLCLFFIPVNVWAACTGSSPTWTATSNYAAVNSCLSQATVGDTINVDAGTSTWNSTLTITKGIHIIGNGVGSTNINSGASPLIDLVPSNQSLNAEVEIAGFSFDSNENIVIQADAGNISTFQTNVNIHDNDFSGSPSQADGGEYIMNGWLDGNGGGMGGVVWHNTFAGGYEHIRSGGTNHASTYTATDAWPGTKKSLFIEDNVFTVTAGEDYYISDTFYNATRIVWRYNTFTHSNNMGNGFMDWHGGEGGVLSSLGQMIYGNNAPSQGSKSWGWAKARGGKGMIFYNNVNTTGSVTDGSFFTQSSFCPSAYTNYQMQRQYNWNNRKNQTTQSGDMTKDGDPDTSCDGIGDYPAIDWNVFNYEPSFDGSSGVGCGSSLPDPTGFPDRLGFWVTNQSCANVTGLVGDDLTNPSRNDIEGTLYHVVNEAWVELYTPYTYPHPLRDEASPTAGITGDSTLSRGTIQ